MSFMCSHSDCPRKASIFCDCSRNKTYICITHLAVHTAQPGTHNTQRLQGLQESNSSSFIKCESPACSGFAKVFCSCNCKNMCFSCFEDHAIANPGIKHTIEVRSNYKPSYDDLLHPLDLFLSRIHCDTSTILKIKSNNLTVRDILRWDYMTLNSMSEILGLSSTVKFILWEEINYIRIVTEKVYLRNDYMARLMFGFEEISRK